MKNTPTVHNEASYGDIAKKVIMPGDPLRAKYIAETYLENPVCFNTVRGMLGFTGMYKGKKVSVMGSGMGIPSMGIYSYELYKYYGVEEIVRIGSCGAYDDKLNLLDVVLADSAWSQSNFALNFRNSDKHDIVADLELTNKIEATAEKLNINVKRGKIATTECFDIYINNKGFIEELKKSDKIAVEMEAYALFNVADELNKKAACILSVVDSIYKEEKVPTEDREKKLNDMIILALEAI